ncbi:MAG: hypothetical protein WD342_10135 [Verrucomicrobiales bacterium]
MVAVEWISRDEPRSNRLKLLVGGLHLLAGGFVFLDGGLEPSAQAVHLVLELARQRVVVARVRSDLFFPGGVSCFSVSFRPPGGAEPFTAL